MRSKVILLLLLLLFIRTKLLHSLWRFALESSILSAHTWHDHLVAALAPVAVLPRAALAAHYLAIVAGSEGLAGQRLVALGAAEAVLVPVAVLMVQLLGADTRHRVSRGAPNLITGGVFTHHVARGSRP